MLQKSSSFDSSMPLRQFRDLVGSSLFGDRYGYPEDSRDQQDQLADLLLHFLANGTLRVTARLDLPEKPIRSRRNTLLENALPSVVGEWKVEPAFWLGDRARTSLKAGTATISSADLAPKLSKPSPLAMSLRRRAGLPKQPNEVKTFEGLRPDIKVMADVPLWVPLPRKQLKALSLLPLPSAEAIKARYFYLKLETFEIVAATWRYLAVANDKDLRGRHARVSNEVRRYLLAQGAEEDPDRPIDLSKRVQVIVRNVLRQFDQPNLSSSVWVASRPESATRKSKKSGSE